MSEELNVLVDAGLDSSMFSLKEMSLLEISLDSSVLNISSDASFGDSILGDTPYLEPRLTVVQSAEDELVNSLSNLEIEKPSNIILYKISISSKKIKNILKEESIDEEFKSNLEKLNQQEEFHITVYFPGKENKFEAEYSSIVEKSKCRFHIISIGLSDNSCVMRVDDDITYDNGEGIHCSLPYHGNDIRHITIASADGIKPVDSPKALTDGIEYILREPVLCYGEFETVRKTFSRRKTVVTEK
jgi:hypothetical protein